MPSVLEIAERSLQARKSPLETMKIVSGGEHYAPWHLQVLNDRLMDCADRKIDRLMVNMPPRHALALDTPIATPTGWTTMGEVNVGDYVFGADGKPTRVKGVSPVFFSRPVYNVTTNDGDTVVADAEHLWEVTLATGGTQGGQRTAKRLVTTEAIARPRCKRPLVRCAAPLQTPSLSLPIDPYVLGAWLGDGTSINAGITASIEDIADMRSAIEARGYTTSVAKLPIRFKVDGLFKELRINGLLGNKHVPSAYLRGSIEQRLLLLQGLMDTDGSVSKEGQCSFTNTKRHLVEGVYELVCSLGYKASNITQGTALLNGKNCGPYWRTSFYMPNCFLMPRKRTRCVEVVRADRYIRAEHTGEMRDVRCISVEANDGLFLAGRSMLVTHNSKSFTISYYFPLWYLGTHPDQRIMLASYEAELAALWGRKVRDALAVWGETLFGIKVSEKSSAADRWDIEGHAGGMVCVGVGGPLTGRGADVLLLDDIIKNSEEARSTVIREKQWDWWTGTAQTRLEPNGIVVMLGTRWHGDDLFGRVLEHEPEEWDVLSFPAIATHDEKYRKEGEALWPERYDVPALERIRKRSPFWFNAEYQCSPSGEEGDIFKRHGIRYWRAGKVTDQNGHVLNGYLLKQANGEEIFVKEASCWKFISVDLAASEREYADYTVYQVWAVTPTTEMILIDQVRARMPGPEKLPVLRELHSRYETNYVGIEKAGFQLDFIQNARWAGLPVIEMKPKGDKHGRALEAAAKWDSGMIYIPSNAYWVGAFIEEICTFDNAPHDDQVDTMSYAALEVSKRGFAPQHAYGLHECHKCSKLYTVNEKVGLDRPCTSCGTRPQVDVEELLAPVPILT